MNIHRITVAIKVSIFWNLAPCSPLKVNRRFRGTYLHPQGRRISQVRNQHEAGGKHVFPKRVLTFSSLYGIICQKTKRFITTAV
jgi:hypothetical protein